MNVPHTARRGQHSPRNLVALFRKYKFRSFSKTSRADSVFPSTSARRAAQPETSKIEEHENERHPADSLFTRDPGTSDVARRSSKRSHRSPGPHTSHSKAGNDQPAERESARPHCARRQERTVDRRRDRPPGKPGIGHQP